MYVEFSFTKKVYIMKNLLELDYAFKRATVYIVKIDKE